MNVLDEATFLRLWDTSPPIARARYRRSAGLPAYDAEPAPMAPRDIRARCASCNGPFVIRPAGCNTAHRIYCSVACRNRAYYRRHKAAVLATKRGRDAANRAEVLVIKRDHYRRTRTEILAYKRDLAVWNRRAA